MEESKQMCSHCELEFDEGELDGHCMCADCAGLHVECWNCGELVLESDSYSAEQSNGNGNVTLCSDCYDITFTCDRCEKIAIGDATSVGNELWCDSCVSDHSFECHRCHELASYSDVNSVVDTSNGRTSEWCSDCASNYSSYCELCDESYSDDLGHCPNCENDDSGIRDYNYKPVPNFVGFGLRHYGVELEVESIGNKAFAVPEEDQWSHLYYKHDGSLTCGFEIVTHPHTLDAFYASHEQKTSLFGAIDDLQGKAKSHDTKTCGLHVHVSRPSEMTCAKMMSFVYLNTPMFEVLCRRSAGQYCCVDSIPVVSKGGKRLLDGGDRYGTIADRGATLEFRLPKGTLNADTVMATIEMVDALVSYCESTTTMKLSAQGYLDHCKSYKFIPKYDKYIGLVGGVIPDKKKPRIVYKPKVYDKFMVGNIRVERTSDMPFDHAGPDYSRDDVPLNAVFASMSTSVMERHYEEIMRTAEAIQGDLLSSQFSKIDVILIATTDVMCRLDIDMNVDRVALSVVASRQSNRLKTIFYSVGLT